MFRHRGFLCFWALLLTAGAAASWLLCVPAGSAWLVRQLLRRWSPVAETHVDRIDGSVLAGLSAQGLRLRGARGLPPDCAISIGTAVVVPLGSLLRYGPDAELHDVLIEGAPEASRITAERVEWTGALLTASGVHAEGLARAAEGSTLDAQEVMRPGRRRWEGSAPWTTPGCG